MSVISRLGVNIDGVLLKDTFSPVLRMIILKLGHEYTSEIEKQLLSQNQQKAAAYVIDKFKLPYSREELIGLYFKERSAYVKTAGNMVAEGAGAFLAFTRSINIEVFCYGGLPEEYFRKETGPLAAHFSQYICTNDFRPGLKEIIFNIYGALPREFLFIDDVNAVAEAARVLNCPFIGIPSTDFQKEGMLKTGVKHIVSSIQEIDADLLERIEKEIEEDRVWGEKPQSA